MENRFVVKTTLSKQDVQALTHQQVKKTQMIMWVACIVLVVGTAMVWVQGGKYKIALAVATPVAILINLVSEKFSAAMIYRNANKEAGETSYTFTDSDIYMNCKLQQGGIPYNIFEQILETDERFFLCFQRSAFIMPKKDFTEGSIDGFRSFIAEKTGKEVKRVKG